MDSIKVGIVGGTGYTGVELLRLLSSHPHSEILAVTARDKVGLPVSDLFPNLRRHVDISFKSFSEAGLKKCDVVFFATPHGVAMKEAHTLINDGVRIIDLSADFRIKDISVWEKWYGMTHACPEILANAVYGLPEANRKQIRNADIVANPGCYPTAVQLGFLPLIKANVLSGNDLIADVKSGVSGGGRKAETSFLLSEASDNLKAYGVAGHRHLPEILQELELASSGPLSLTFIPHLVPMIRGIHATLYAKVDRKIDIQELFELAYENEAFVDILPPGTYPETRSVRGSNYCQIAVHRPQNQDTVVILSVIDNLVKGAAGQAVQNMNIMFGLTESVGLEQIALLP